MEVRTPLAKVSNSHIQSNRKDKGVKRGYSITSNLIRPHSGDPRIEWIFQMVVMINQTIRLNGNNEERMTVRGLYLIFLLTISYLRLYYFWTVRGKDDSARKLVGGSWIQDNSTEAAIDYFCKIVKHWNIFTFGNVGQRKQRCQARAKEDSKHYLEPEMRLQEEMDTILFCRSFCGSKNQGFNGWKEATEIPGTFHLPTMIRQRQNEIVRLKNTEGGMVQR